MTSGPTMKTPTTALSHHTLDAVYYREKNLVDDILKPGAQPDFVREAMAHILGREIGDGELRVMNAILITMMEHGFTPSAISTRSIYMSAPENLQGAVAAGLMAVGSQFVGTVENNARLLARIAAVPEGEKRALAEEIVDDHKARKVHMPGFGHHLHRPDDPRAIRLLEIGAENGLDGAYVKALRLLGEVIDEKARRHITINATGSVAALLGEMNVPVDLMRGFSVLGRTAGLVAHIAEERERPSARFIWELVDKTIPYEA
ncbi:citryl-CoA lyase [Azorhizobium oxalatiphilum]|uniref:citrate synthase (unknown stereospecificity) n=1 Tax=Azorhizobium oxalatiphilum TaxID=980631 RepID=A0A917C5T0_9HYPH|nr:citryl-CoA lyase [Azorhizobium oxalatiphilum]GGF71476.1 citryl-CoA lyase [Azorhizobium oxalatiphilum]